MATHFPLDATLAAPSAALDGNFDISALGAFSTFHCFRFLFFLFVCFDVFIT